MYLLYANTVLPVNLTNEDILVEHDFDVTKMFWHFEPC